MKNIFFISLILFCCHIYAQDIPMTTEQQVEGLAEKDIDPDDEHLLQQLDYLKRHPIRLNTASKEDLIQLPLLHEWQVMNFLSYRKFAGKLIDLHELQAVPGWDAILIQKILPYVTLQEPVMLKEKILSRVKGEHDLLLRTSMQMEPFSKTDPGVHYNGSRQHILFRYRYQYKDLFYAGVTGDKDAGEQFFRGYQKKGFDFYSFHLFMKKIGMVKSLALGDFIFNLGQGLLSWQSVGFGKSAEVMSIKRSAPVLAPYRSAGEFNFYRGGAATIEFGKFECAVMFSRKSLTAHIDDSTDVFTGINMSGLHRTESENNQKNMVSQFSYGGRVGYTSHHFTAGINFLSHRFSLPLMKKDIPYNKYAFSGTSLSQFSADLAFTFKNFHLFGECASELNLSPALVTGLLITMDRSVDLSLLYRNFSRGFRSLFGNAFSENSLPVNEKGGFSGIDFHPAGKWKVHVYADVFSFPWLKFRVDAPSKGTDYLVQLEYHPTRQAEIYIQYRTKEKSVNSSPDSPLDYPSPELKKNLRFNLVNQVNNHFTFSSRVEALWYRIINGVVEQGFLGYLQANFMIRKIKAGVRYQYFETGSYNSRIYAYEPDVQSSFSIPAFSGKGFLYLVNLNYSASKRMKFWMRWACISDKKSDPNSHSSNDYHAEIKVQCEVIF